MCFHGSVYTVGMSKSLQQVFLCEDGVYQAFLELLNDGIVRRSLANLFSSAIACHSHKLCW